MRFNFNSPQILICSVVGIFLLAQRSNQFTRHVGLGEDFRLVIRASGAPRTQVPADWR